MKGVLILKAIMPLHENRVCLRETKQRKEKNSGIIGEKSSKMHIQLTKISMNIAIQDGKGQSSPSQLFIVFVIT